MSVDARRGFAGLLAVAVLCTGTPAGGAPPTVASRAEDACGGGRGTCCCGVAGGCGMCGHETVTRRPLDDREPRWSACPGPAQRVAAPASNPKHVTLASAWHAPQWSVIGCVAPLRTTRAPRPAPAPEPPPPRTLS